MKGQWVGNYTGSHFGDILVNVDERVDCFQGTAYLSPKATPLIRNVVFFRTRDKSPNLHIESRQVLTVNANTDEVATPEFLISHYGESLALFSSVNVTGIWDSARLQLSWTTDKDSVGQGDLLLVTSSGSPSALQSTQQNWVEFKAGLGQWERGKFLFRGQKEPRRLRTSFHRYY